MRVAFSAARAAVCMGGREAVCTIGNFDGVHRGHEALIRRTTTRAHELGLPSLLITFEPHPAQVLSTRVVQGLSSRVQRLERFAALGVDVALLLPFTRDFASRRAEEFCRHVLADTLRVRQLVLGYDFCMGSDQAGAETLVGCGREFGFDVSCVSAVMYEGVPVSSSRIRKAVEAGYLEHARAMLGRPYAVRGEVVHGAGRGGPLLGFATANMDIRGLVMPPPAIYATSAGKTVPPALAEDGCTEVVPQPQTSFMPSMTSFGHNPTFGEGSLSLETHILDFSEDIYGTELELTFLGKLRDEMRFSGPDELVAQLNADREARRALTVAPEGTVL